MVKLIKTKDVKIITKEGECQVNIVLDLNINITQSGITIDNNNEQLDKPKEETSWMIPTFQSGEKVKFGKEKE